MYQKGKHVNNIRGEDDEGKGVPKTTAKLSGGRPSTTTLVVLFPASNTLNSTGIRSGELPMYCTPSISK